MDAKQSGTLRRMLRNATAKDPGLYGVTIIYTLCAAVQLFLPVLLSGLVIGLFL